MRHSRKAFLAIALSATCLTQPALAQSVAAPEAGAAQSDNGGLPDIVVTARKSSEKLQSVPLAITAVSSAMLDKANARQVRDIAMLTPGLTIGGDAAERAQQPSIRGLSFAGGANTEGNVAVMVDGIYIANPGAVSLGMMELERVEVVKGPQSALYGANAFAGAINYVSKVPPTSFEGRVEARVGTYESRGAKLTLGGPVVPGLIFARGTIAYDHDGGSYRDAVNGNKLGGFEKYDADLRVRITPSPTATIDLGFYYGNDKFGMAPQVSFPNNCARNAAGALTAYCGPLPSTESLEPLVAPSYLPPDASGNDRKVKMLRAKGTFDLDSVKLEVTGGYFDGKSRNFAELFGVRDGLVFNLAGTPAGTVTLPGFSGGELSNKDYSGEVRLSSNGSGPLHWSFGGYFYQSNQNAFTDIAINSDGIPAGRTIACPTALNALCQFWLSPGGRTPPKRGLSIATNRQASAFGSLAYDVTPALSIQAEVRYTNELKTQNVLFNIAAPTVDADGPNGQRKLYHYWNPRFTVNYKVTPDNLVYISAAKGTKSGGFNSSAITANELAYNPESNWTYEIGSKNTLFGRRVRLNIAAFYVNWKDLQILVPSAVATIGSVTNNFGSVKAYGGEVELAAKVAEGVSLSGGIAYTNPKFGKDAFDFSNVATCRLIPTCAPLIQETVQSARGPLPAIALDGLTRVLASKWQFTAGFDFNRDVGGDWMVFGTANYKYESKQYADVDNLRFTPHRNTLSLQAGVEHGPFRFTLWGQNVLNDITPYATSAGIGITRYNDGSRVPKMSVPEKSRFGATIAYKF